MPWAEDKPEIDDPGVRVPLGRELAPPKPALTGAEVTGAAFRTENPVVALYRAATEKQYPVHNGYEAGADAQARYPQLFGRYTDNFVGSVGPEDTDARAAKLTEYEDDRARIGQAGWGGTVATLGAGILSPEQWIVPGASLVRAGKVGWSVGKTAAAIGMTAGTQQAIAEGVLHTFNPVRGWDESAMNVGIATLAGGILGGGAAAWITRGERIALEAKLAADRRARTMHVTGEQPADATVPPSKAVGDLLGDTPSPGGAEGQLLPAGKAAGVDVPGEAIPVAPRLGEGVAARAAGAAVTDTAEARLAGIAQPARDLLAAAAPDISRVVEAAFARANQWIRPAWERAAQHISTDLGLMSSPSAVVRRAAAEHIETALVTKGNLAGEVTSNVIPLDRAIKSVKGRLAEQVADGMREIYKRYYFGTPDVKLAEWRAFFEDKFGMNADSKLMPSQFDREVIAALNTGDQHAIPHVQEAAEFIRKTVYDPLAEWMERVNPNFKRADMLPGESYSPRRWLADKIQTMPNEFVNDVLLPHLIQEQKVKAAAKERITGLNTKLNQAQDMTEKFDAMLERLDAREDALRERLSERAMEVKRTGTREQALQERASSAAEDVTEIQDLIDSLRKDVSDPAVLARVDSLEKELAELRRQERPVTQANLEQLEREELGGVLSGTNRLAAEMLVGRRKIPKAPSFLDWIADNGGLVDVGGDVKSIVDKPPAGLINKAQGRELDSLAERMRTEFPSLRNTDIQPNQILEWIGESNAGRQPDFMLENLPDRLRPHVEAGKTAGALDAIFQRAGIQVDKVSDVAKILRDERVGAGGVGLDDLERIAGEMEAAGQDVPVSFRREGVATELVATREDIANARALLNRARDAKVSRETRSRVAEAVSAEAGLAARSNLGRLGILESRLDLADRRRDLLQSSREIFEAEEARYRGQIEDELAKWQGKTTNEVRSELKARDKYAATRALAQQDAGPQLPSAREGPRLESADRPVDKAVRKIIESDRDLSVDELRAKAEEIKNHITGLPIGRLPYDDAAAANAARDPALASARGPLLPRDFIIPYDLAKDWIDHDLERTLSSYTRTMVPDAILWERHPGEGPDRPSFYRGIELDYDNLIREAKPGTREAKRLGQLKQRDIGMLQAVTDRERGLLNPTMTNWGRFGAAVKALNQMADLGGAGVTGITDFGGPVLEHGMWNWFKEGITPYFTHIAGSDLHGMQRAELKAMGIGGEMEGAARRHALTEEAEVWNPTTRTEQVIKKASDSFFYLNMQNQETKAAKRMAGGIAMSQMLNAIEAQVAGTATKRQVRQLAQANLSPELTDRIWAQFTRPDGGNVVDGVKLSNTANWIDDQAREFFIAAIGRDVDRSVITPGAVKPIWLSTTAGSLLGQYKSFAMAATTKVLLSGLQTADARFLQAITAQMGLGALVYATKTAYRGEDFKSKPAEWIKESMHYAMFPGILEDINMVGDKFSGGRINYHRLYGAEKPVSRGAERTAIDTVLGPTAGKIRGLAKFGGALGSGNWSGSDVHALRGLVAAQNVPGIQRLYNDAENGFNHAFGIKPRKNAPSGFFTRP